MLDAEFRKRLTDGGVTDEQLQMIDVFVGARDRLHAAYVVPYAYELSTLLVAAVEAKGYPRETIAVMHDLFVEAVFAGMFLAERDINLRKLLS